MDYISFFEQRLQSIKAEKRYRTFIPLERTPGKAPLGVWHSPQGPKDVVVWCSNDYMSLGLDPLVCEAAIKAVEMFGVGSGGTRNIAGTTPWHPYLEGQVAAWHGKQAGLLFSSGYVANEATLATLGKLMPNCVMFSDEKNHASIIQGVRSSGVKRIIFRHNNMRDLESQLAILPLETPKVIAVVSLYSMDGDRAPLHDLAHLAQKYGALLYVDEVHAIGLYGPYGAGLCAEMGVEADIIQANFAKSVGVVGGYIAGSATFIDCIRSYANGFIFTTSLPPAVVAAASQAITLLQQRDDHRQKLHHNVKNLQQAFNKAGIGYVHTDTHIVPVVLGDPFLCQEVSERLLTQHGCYVQPINYPTVPRGQERLRIIVTPDHTDQHIQHFVQALYDTLASFNLDKAA